jgi:GntR family transcriptional regulator
MLIVVDPHSGVPVYRQIMEQVRFHVASGLMKAGDELPSTRLLSAELGVNPMTISKAYAYLERDGVVDRRPGRPLVVSALANGRISGERIEQLRKSLEQAVTAVRQLAISRDEAVRVFSDMLGALPNDCTGNESEDDG